MSRLDALLTRNPGLGWRRAALLVMALVIAALAWAASAEFEQVAVAHGEVAPRDRVKVIQHLDGGIIKALFVREGEVVAAGAPLVELTLPSGQLNEPELRVRLDAQRLKLARLRAAGSGAALGLPPEIAARRPELAAAETEAYRAEQARLASSLEGLFDDGLTSQMEHLERRQSVSRLEGELAALAPAIPRAEAALAEAEEKLRETELTFRREDVEAARDLESEIARTRELLATAAEREARTVLRSPVEGIVKNLRYATVGGVVRTGEPIMELVPTHDNLVVEARLSPADRGPVRVGQPVRIKISTYDFLRYGALEGTISQISADTTPDPDAGPYFRLVVEPARGYLGAAPEALPIMPGMVAQVDVLTGRKSLLASVLEPLLRIRDEAFRERI